MYTFQWGPLSSKAKSPASQPGTLDLYSWFTRVDRTQQRNKSERLGTSQRSHLARETIIVDRLLLFA